LLKLKNITTQNQELLVDISFEATEKGIYGILLPNTSARNALCEIISGISSDYEGEVDIKGNSYSFKDSEKQQITHRRKVGYLPSVISLYKDMTVYEILDFVGNAKKISSEKKYKQIKEAVELVGLDAYKDVLVSKLTLWQTKRAVMAMALLGNPDVIVLNEPFGGLDRSATEDFKSLLKMLGGVKCVILATSNADSIEDICKNVAIVVDGKILINDTVESINEKLNASRSMLVRVISKTDNANDDVTEIVNSIDGVISSSIRSKSEQGEIVLNLECKPDSDAELILDAFRENGYLVLSHEIIKLTLDDICSTITKGEEK
jgi:ABC-2 type transport system ATP-binding protein